MLNDIQVTDYFSLTLQRTLRVPNDGGTYPLPPGLGTFPIYPRLALRRSAVADLPAADYYVPMYQSEALWFRFLPPYWLPHAVQVAAGGVDVLTGEPLREELVAQPQNYLCCPKQPWLDGIRTAPGIVSQFVAAPLGAGHTLEEQFSDRPLQGGITIGVVPPKPGLFEEPPAEKRILCLRSQKRLGLGGGGRIEQKIYPDPYGLDTWDYANSRQIRIQIINSAHFAALTGRPAPPTPVTAAAYTKYGLPWFCLYDEASPDIGVTPELQSLKTVPNADPSLHWVRVQGIQPV